MDKTPFFAGVQQELFFLPVVARMLAETDATGDDVLRNQEDRKAQPVPEEAEPGNETARRSAPPGERSPRQASSSCATRHGANGAVGGLILDGRWFAVALIAAGYGRAYDGGKRNGWCE